MGPSPKFSWFLEIIVVTLQKNLIYAKNYIITIQLLDMLNMPDIMS